MSRLTIVGYDDPDQAEEVRLKLRKLQREYVMDLKDAVVAVKDEQGKVKLHQSVDFSADAHVRLQLLGIADGPDPPKCGGKCCLRCAHRGGDRRALYEGVGCHAESRQFSPLRADRNTHAAQGQASGRAKGNRWQNFADHALARGPKRPPGRLECGKRRELKRCGTPARSWERLADGRPHCG